MAFRSGDSAVYRTKYLTGVIHFCYIGQRVRHGLSFGADPLLWEPLDLGCDRHEEETSGILRLIARQQPKVLLGAFNFVVLPSVLTLWTLVHIHLTDLLSYLLNDSPIRSCVTIWIGRVKTSSRNRSTRPDGRTCAPRTSLASRTATTVASSPAPLSSARAEECPSLTFHSRICPCFARKLSSIL